jgi:hypothetical protein
VNLAVPGIATNQTTKLFRNMAILMLKSMYKYLLLKGILEERQSRSGVRDFIKLAGKLIVRHETYENLGKHVQAAS